MPSAPTSPPACAGVRFVPIERGLGFSLAEEYPPGITLLPMKSKTLQPFRTTNLVLVRATNGAGESTYSDVFACGDALLLDPECSSQVHAEGHTDGHVGFLHVKSNTLIVGDHCVHPSSDMG
ncbi:hypothetical protein C2845_PM17G02900 [Panicum miliaceum]|uniref:Uncharacterized protein n=1 Tax=Panicum miliaceum TaxID=4540 RepID=A0A3L6Q272_PANMI|nr:hypothetical protein C2845_PM17G02900 [Panicum miliaceum]